MPLFSVSAYGSFFEVGTNRILLPMMDRKSSAADTQNRAAFLKAQHNSTTNSDDVQILSDLEIDDIQPIKLAPSTTTTTLTTTTTAVTVATTSALKRKRQTQRQEDEQEQEDEDADKQQTKKKKLEDNQNEDKNKTPCKTRQQKKNSDFVVENNDKNVIEEMDQTWWNKTSTHARKNFGTSVRNLSGRRKSIANSRYSV